MAEVRETFGLSAPHLGRDKRIEIAKLLLEGKTEPDYARWLAFRERHPKIEKPKKTREERMKLLKQRRSSDVREEKEIRENRKKLTDAARSDRKNERESLLKEDDV